MIVVDINILFKFTVKMNNVIKILQKIIAKNNVPCSGDVVSFFSRWESKLSHQA